MKKIKNKKEISCQCHIIDSAESKDIRGNCEEYLFYKDQIQKKNCKE